MLVQWKGDTKPLKPRPSENPNHYPGEEEKPEINKDAKIEKGQVALLALRGPIPRSADGSDGISPEVWDRTAKVVRVEGPVVGGRGEGGTVCGEGPVGRGEGPGGDVRVVVGRDRLWGGTPENIYLLVFRTT